MSSKLPFEESKTLPKKNHQEFFEKMGLIMEFLYTTGAEKLGLSTLFSIYDHGDNNGDNLGIIWG